jgi:hypothetical protein
MKMKQELVFYMIKNKIIYFHNHSNSFHWLKMLGRIFFLLLVCFVLAKKKSELQVYFDLLDINKDGILSQSELSNYLLDFTHKEKNSKFATSTAAKRILGNQGNISWKQFNQKYSPFFNVEPGKPEQVHISVTEKSDEMRIMWLTAGPTKSSNVRYGISNLNQEEKGIQFTYQFPQPWHTDKFIHKVTLKGLQPGSTYQYQVGDKETNSWGKIYGFKTLKSKFPLNLILFGDMGVLFPAGFMVSKDIEEHFKKQPFDLVSHVGDISV